VSVKSEPIVDRNVLARRDCLHLKAILLLSVRGETKTGAARVYFTIVPGRLGPPPAGELGHRAQKPFRSAIRDLTLPGPALVSTLVPGPIRLCFGLRGRKIKVSPGRARSGRHRSNGSLCIRCV
jgi:hypothetical protein